MRALIAALHERDNYTRHHCDRVVTLSRDLGTACGVSFQELQVLRIAALFHDVGKIGVPDHVLLKPGPLTDEEWVLMREHAARGERIFTAMGLPIAEEVAPIIRHHHEAVDGNGYPDGLRGEAIPLLARILTVADAYDAMATPRPYRNAMPHHRIMAILEAEQGTKLDAEIVRKFTQTIERSPARYAAGGM